MHTCMHTARPPTHLEGVAALVDEQPGAGGRGDGVLEVGGDVGKIVGVQLHPLPARRHLHHAIQHKDKALVALGLLGTRGQRAHVDKRHGKVGARGGGDDVCGGGVGPQRVAAKDQALGGDQSIVALVHGASEPRQVCKRRAGRREEQGGGTCFTAGICGRGTLWVESHASGCAPCPEDGLASKGGGGRGTARAVAAAAAAAATLSAAHHRTERPQIWRAPAGRSSPRTPAASAVLSLHTGAGVSGQQGQHLGCGPFHLQQHRHMPSPSSPATPQAADSSRKRAPPRPNLPLRLDMALEAR